MNKYSILLVIVLHILIVYRGISVADAKGPPTITESLYQMRHVIREGESILRLVCPVESIPAPLVAWVKDDVVIHPGWERYRLNNEKLAIRDLELTDSGVFVCKATNGFGTIEVRHLIYVFENTTVAILPPADFEEDVFDVKPGEEEPPTLVHIGARSTSIISSQPGNTVRLTCKLKGRPMPVVTWYKDGIRIVPARPDVLIDYSEAVIDDETSPTDAAVIGISTLHLVDVHDAESGRYACAGFNRAGSVNYTYTVKIAGEMSLPDHRTTSILYYPRNVTAVYGETASFLCIVQSETTPRIQWVRHFEQNTSSFSSRDPGSSHRAVNQTSGRMPYVVLEDAGYTVSRKDGSYINKLVIPRVTEHDEGWYICSTTDGRDFNYRSAYLTVLPGPHQREHVRRLQEGYDSQDSAPSSATSNSPILPVILALIVVAGIVFVAIVVVIFHRRRPNNSPCKIRSQVCHPSPSVPLSSSSSPPTLPPPRREVRSGSTSLGGGSSTVVADCLAGPPTIRCHNDVVKSSPPPSSFQLPVSQNNMTMINDDRQLLMTSSARDKHKTSTSTVDGQDHVSLVHERRLGLNNGSAMCCDRLPTFDCSDQNDTLLHHQLAHEKRRFVLQQRQQQLQLRLHLQKKQRLQYQSETGEEQYRQSEEWKIFEEQQRQLKKQLQMEQNMEESDQYYYEQSCKFKDCGGNRLTNSLASVEYDDDDDY